MCGRERFDRNVRVSSKPKREPGRGFETAANPVFVLARDAGFHHGMELVAPARHFAPDRASVGALAQRSRLRPSLMREAQLNLLIGPFEQAQFLWLSF
jgi:hypothetical protein